ncbi:copper-binding protein [Candidatus Nitrosopelagicus sp.]|nr:copper-binding protein [Candidatus Nitrosopelagicus sp.]|tara:strand:- start:296 stop:1120 length:825 start_codon:yes stop_codon:yes gene_type:complete
MKYLLGLMLLPLLLTPAFAESAEDYDQVLPSENGTLDIGLSVVPEAEANAVSKLHIGWIKPGFNKIQEHIDYKITVIKDGQNIFGPIPLTHTSIGTVKIPVEFTSNGEHQVKVEMEGILFQPIPLETTYFTIEVGGEQTSQSTQQNNNEGGGCLIATAAFGSEMSSQVQQLREIRDNVVMQTSSGKIFMSGFNQVYYSFSPYVADYERENPVFKEAVKVTLTPMLTSFSLLAHVPVDTEHEMLGYGIGVILLNVGMYFVAPAMLFTVIKKKLRK